MSSEVTGAANGSVTAKPDRAPAVAAAPGPANGEAAEGEGQDPWFSPEPKLPDGAVPDAVVPDASALGQHAGNGLGSGAADADPGSDTAQWFLRTGRAGLLPDAMTVDSDEAEPGPAGPRPRPRTGSAGAPPWAGESPGSVASAPPPWETGPWPGPGASRPGRAAGRRAADSAGRADAAGSGAVAGSAAAAGSAGLPGDAVPVSLPAGILLAAGIVPLVVPGLVAGIVGVRRARAAGSSQLASWAAIALSVGWALVIVLVFAGGSGGQANACASYPASVRHAYTGAVTDLASATVSPAQAADIRRAASEANAAAAAAAAGQTGVRTQLAQLANDLEQAGADATAGHQVPAPLLQDLAADGARLAAACPAR